jgi:DNA modification methylase
MNLRPDAIVDHEGPGAVILRHDARDLPLGDESVDLVVTSPPYFALRSYRDDGEHYDGQLGSEATPQEFISNLVDCVREWARVLKPSGSMFVNLGDKYAGKSRLLLPHRFAIACIDQLNLIVRMDMVWSKPNGLPESVTDRVRASHEYWFHIVKEPRYFSGLDEIREPHKDPDDMTRWYLRNGGREDETPGKAFTINSPGNPLGRLPGSVFTIPTEPLLVPDAIREARGLPDHFAAFPQEWPRKLIAGFSPTRYCTECEEPRTSVVAKDRQQTGAPELYVDSASRFGEVKKGDFRNRGDTAVRINGYSCSCPTPDAPTNPSIVCDPFGGTGTVAGVARTLNRYGVHNDLSADYNRLAAWRIFESGHFQKTEQRTWQDRQGQLL